MARRVVARKVAHKSKSHLGTIGKTAAFLAGPFPDVELLIGAMANPESGIKFVLGIAKKAGRRVSEVQSVIFEKLKWTADAAKQWLRENGFTGNGKDEGATFWRFRQQSPGKYKEFRTIVPGTRPNPGLRLGRRTRYVVYALPGNTSDTGIAQKLRETVPVFQSDDFVEATEEAMRLKRERGMKVWLRDTQEDRFRGQYLPVGLENRPKENPDVADARVAKYGFTKWHNNLSPAETKGKRKSTLLKNWMEGWAAGKRVEKKQGNPESEAAALYEDFHGKPPGETLEIVTDKLEHEWLTQLGLLVELKVATLTNLDATLSFEKDAPNLCSSEDGRQLYIEGGDQALDLKALKMDGDKWLKDSMVIGVAYEVTYQTEKGFQNFKLTDYFHKLGEETGVQPFLLYDPKNQLLSISGGQYQVKPEGIVN